MGAKQAERPPPETSRIDRFIGIALDTLYPPTCPLCGSAAMDGICAPCLQQLPRVDQPCPCCGTPGRSRLVCGRCQGNPPAYERAIVPFCYAPPLAGLIKQYKYRRKITLAEPLARTLARDLAGRIDTGVLSRPQLIVAVPLHWTRLLQRGFNQSLELAKPLSRELGVPLAPTATSRRRRTSSQVNLSLKHRRNNVRGCFELRRELGGESIAIVDDVMTSGETVNALAETLLEGGARRVQVWALARA